MNTVCGIFLDRDGTLIFDKNYLKNPMDVQLIEGVIESLHIFTNFDYRIFLFSNQSGVSRGLFTMHDVELCNLAMIEKIGLGNIFSDICVATEGPEEKQIYRKPSPRFINEMIKKYSLDKKKCFMIGDKICDLLAGINAGIQPIFVNTGNKKTNEIEALIRSQKCREYLNLLQFALLEIKR